MTFAKSTRWVLTDSSTVFGPAYEGLAIRSCVVILSYTIFFTSSAVSIAVSRHFRDLHTTQKLRRLTKLLRHDRPRIDCHKYYVFKCDRKFCDNQVHSGFRDGIWHGVRMGVFNHILWRSETGSEDKYFFGVSSFDKG